MPNLITRRRRGAPVPPADAFTTLSPRWSWQFGSGQIAGGGLQGATLAADGNELVTNGGFASDTSGWSAGPSTGLSSVAGGQSGNCLQAIILLEGVGGYASQTPTTFVVGNTYAFSGYQKNGNKTGSYRMPYDGSLFNAPQDNANWSQYSTSFVATTTSILLRLGISSNSLGGYTLFDALSLQLMCAAAYDLAYRERNPRLIVWHASPAAPSVTPWSLMFREVDWLNKWEVRVTPNTAGNDLTLIEWVAGAATTRATADIDWTPAGVDALRLEASGATIKVYVMKAGAVSWSEAIAFTGAATGLTADMHGYAIYETGVTRVVRWQPLA